MAKGLTKKQEIFVAEYLTDFNAVRAAIAAGYSVKSAAAQSSQLIANPKIASEIEKKTAKRMQKLDLSADKVLAELGKLGFSNMLDYISVGNDGAAVVDLSALDRDKAAAIQEIVTEEYSERTGDVDENGKPTWEKVKRVKFKLAEKRGSLELLGKHLKLFTDKVEHTGGIVMLKNSVPRPAR